jgi:hypothetical protein
VASAVDMRTPASLALLHKRLIYVSYVRDNRF